MRRRSLLCLLPGLLALISGCSPANAPKSGPPAPGSATTAAAGGGVVRAGVVLDTGGVDDRSFNAAAVSGLMRAKKELGLGENNVKYVESNGPADFKPNLTGLASQNYSIIFAVGYMLENPLKEVAPQFPDVKFAIIDAPAPDSPNAAGLQFREQEGAFLAGYLAGAMSKTKKIGFVGGEKIPITERFEAGYKAGARTADPAVQVIASYTGDWNDTSKGRSQAEQQFGSGADIIIQGAGKAGLGVIEAAKARGPGYYAIGTDQDQDGIAPGRVLTTMEKHTDVAVFDMIKRLKAGQFEKGTHVYGVKDGGISLSDLKYTKQNIPPAVLANLDRLKQRISAGEIVPPTTLKELESFQPPRL